MMLGGWQCFVLFTSEVMCLTAAINRPVASLQDDPASRLNTPVVIAVASIAV